MALTSTQTTQGNWTDTANSLADVIDSFLTMKNNLEEKRQKREINSLQMEQARLNMEKERRSLRLQDDLQKSIEGIEKTKTINLPEADVKSAYTDEAWESMPTEEKSKLLTQEVPKSDAELLKEVVRIQMEHGLKTGQIPLNQAAAYLKQLQAEQNPQANKGVAAVQEYEQVTGVDPNTRGTPDYKRGFIKYLADKAGATGERYPQYQQVNDMPGWGYNRRTNTYSLVGQGGKPVVSISGEEAPKMTPERVAEIKASTIAYKNIEKQYAMVGQAEKQAERNIEIARKYSDKYIRTKYPTPNALLAQWNVQTGDVAVEQFKVALLAASREYMRVVTGGARSAAELSVSAQETADKLLNASKSWDVFNAQTDVMLQELSATKKSYDSQMSELKDKISGRKTQESDRAEEPKKKKSPIPKSVWVGRAMAKNPGMSRQDVEAEFDKKYME